MASRITSSIHLNYPNSYAAALDILQRNRGISRAELAIATGLTAPAITRIVSELIEMGLVLEDGLSTPTFGRPSVRLMINSTKYYVIGIDLARSGIFGIVANLNGTVIYRKNWIPDSTNTCDLTFDCLVDVIQDLKTWANDHSIRIVGIGIGAPGPLDFRKGIINNPPNFPLWRHVPVRDLLIEKFGLPVWLDNDANAQALAERWFGAGKTFDCYVYLAVGTGVGAGVIINGLLYRGAFDSAGELGHATVEASGPRCSCGNYGCLEVYTSVPAIEKIARDFLRQGVPSLILNLAGGEIEKVTVSHVGQAAKQGDALAEKILANVVRYLGVGIVNAVNLFDPEAVLLGREVASSFGEQLIEPVRQIVAERAFVGSSSRVQILPAVLGDDAPVVGAASLVIQGLFHAPEAVLSH